MTNSCICRASCLLCLTHPVNTPCNAGRKTQCMAKAASAEPAMNAAGHSVGKNPLLQSSLQSFEFNRALQAAVPVLFPFSIHPFIIPTPISNTYCGTYFTPSPIPILNPPHVIPIPIPTPTLNPSLYLSLQPHHTVVTLPSQPAQHAKAQRLFLKWPATRTSLKVY